MKKKKKTMKKGFGRYTSSICRRNHGIYPKKRSKVIRRRSGKVLLAQANLPTRRYAERQFGIPLDGDLQILVVFDWVKVVFLLVLVLDNQLFLFLSRPLQLPSLNKLIVKVDEFERNRHADDDAVVFFEPDLDLESRRCTCAGSGGAGRVGMGHGWWVEVGRVCL